MQVFQYNLFFLKLLGLCSDGLTEPTNEFMKIANCYVILIGLAGLMFPCSGIYIINNRHNITLALRSVFVFCASIQWAGSYITFGMKMKKVKELHCETQNHVDSVSTINERKFYAEAEEKCQYVTKLISLGYLYLSIVVFGAALIFAAYCMWTGNYDTSTWLVPYSLSVPFDTSTLLGWIQLWLINTYSGIAYSLCATFFVTYFVSLSYFLMAMCEHFGYLLKMFDTDIEMDQGIKRTPQESYRLASDYKRKMIEIVELHLTIFKVADLVADVNSGVIFSILPCNIVFLAAALYQVEHASDDLYFMILYNMLCVSSSLTWPFGLCNAATKMTTSCAELAETIYNTEWYNFPNELQKYLPLIMARSQRELEFNGFGVVTCDLNKFLRINNSAYSCYLMFRSVEMR